MLETCETRAYKRGEIAQARHGNSRTASGAYGGKMKSYKTILMAAILAVAPAAVVAQSPATDPAPAASATTVPATIANETAPGAPVIEPSTTTDAAGATAAPASAAIDHALPEASVGLPDGRMGLQDQYTDIGLEAAWMHDWILMPVMVAISVLVLGLLGWVAFRYRASANPVASKTSHNTLIEILWTLIPVLILLVIAVPSIQLIAKQYSPPKADLTIKVIGNQWYWTYQYPDNGDFELVSNMLKEKDQVGPNDRYRTDADGPRLLAVDERLVVPAGAVVKLIVTSNDVIHAFAVPAFWSKMDAVPGRLNETWFKVDRPGVYFGQCSELCGQRHAFMPIAVEVVSPAKFAQWVASKGGTMPGAAPAATAEAAPAAEAAAPAPAANDNEAEANAADGAVANAN